MSQEAVVFDPSSPERGWPPFIDWLKAQGLDPNRVRSLVVHDDGSAVAVLLVDDEQGRLKVVDDEIVTRYQRIDSLTGMPPRRFPQ